MATAEGGKEEHVDALESSKTRRNRTEAQSRSSLKYASFSPSNHAILDLVQVDHTKFCQLIWTNYCVPTRRNKTLQDDEV